MGSRRRNISIKSLSGDDRAFWTVIVVAAGQNYGDRAWMNLQLENSVGEPGPEFPESIHRLRAAKLECCEIALELKEALQDHAAEIIKDPGGPDFRRARELHGKLMAAERAAREIQLQAINEICPAQGSC